LSGIKTSIPVARRSTQKAGVNPRQHDFTTHLALPVAISQRGPTLPQSSSPCEAGAIHPIGFPYNQVCQVASPQQALNLSPHLAVRSLPVPDDKKIESDL
jgi:hypothetical protein